jgi:hypothetical protein
VAQLGARFHGMEEVDGSNPSRSTKSLSNKSKTYTQICDLFLAVGRGQGVHVESNRCPTLAILSFSTLG